MRPLPLTGRKDVFANWSGEVDVWFKKLHQYSISEIVDKMIEMLRSPFKPKGREAFDLIFKKISKRRGGSNRSLDNGQHMKRCRKNKWLFGLSELHLAQSKGIFLINVRQKISEVDKIPPAE